MRRLNVIHICDKFGMRGSTVHGVSRLFAWWFPRFDRERYNVKLYAVKDPDPASRTLEESGIGLTYLHRSALNPLTVTSFLKVISKEHADVIHLHGWIAANFGRFAGRMLGVPTIMHEHGVDPKFPLSQRIADRLLSPFNHTVIAVSESVRKFLIANRSVPPAKIRVIYNGAPTDEFAPADAREVAGAREELGIPNGMHVVGTVGRLDTQKGITYFLRAARQVMDILPDVRFVIVGDGPKREELESEAQDLGLDSCVRFTGHRSDVSVIQSLMDLQVFPSLWEGVPLTVFEAMAMGRAIVSTNVDGLAEVLEDGKNALIVAPADSEQLATGMMRLLSDRRLAERLGRNALESSKSFDIGRTVENLESLYDELCAR
jgi:glycosyltransferase involved in cell wall biosynthesis